MRCARACMRARMNINDNMHLYREEQMMNFCFETLFSENLDLEHKRHVFDAASLAQNAYRAHLARRELSRVRDILEGPSATVISKVIKSLCSLCMNLRT